MKYIFIKTEYRKGIVIPLSASHFVDQMQLVKEIDAGKVYTKLDDEIMDIKIIEDKTFKKEAAENKYKREAEQYKNWWYEEQGKNLKLTKAYEDASGKTFKDEDDIL